MDALAPMPRPMVRSATIAKPGLLQSVLKPNLRSWISSLNRRRLERVVGARVVKRPLRNGHRHRRAYERQPAEYRDLRPELGKREPVEDPPVDPVGRAHVFIDEG